MNGNDNASPQLPLGVGMVGAGNFARFCLSAFQEMQEARVIGLTDIDDIQARAVAAVYGTRAYANLDEMLADPAIQIITLHTPPAFHAPLVGRALEAGKHVLCEKPLALTLVEADSLISLAHTRHLLLSTDYVMRPNPLVASLRRIIACGLLGELLHISLDNDAAVENLDRDHWFWNPEISGGIWVEHGVLFFDLFRWLIGQEGVVRGATRMRRESGEVDRVSALVDYGTVSTTFSHTFKRANCFEHTEIRASFVRGSVSLSGWIPVALKVTALLETGQRQELLALCPPNSVVLAAEPVREHGVQASEGAGKARERVWIDCTLKQGKTDVYRAAIQANLRDLVQAIRDPEHALKITAEQARESLRLALDATNYSLNLQKPPVAFA